AVRWREPLHALELLHPALDERRLGRLVAETPDERLDARDLLLLRRVRLRLLRAPLLALLEVRRVVAVVVGEAPARHLGDPLDADVEEVAVVRDEDDERLARGE